MKQLILFAIVAFFTLNVVFAETECQRFKKEQEKKLDVKCTTTGEFMPLQCSRVNKSCYCALPDGTQVAPPSRNRKFCACDIARTLAIKSLKLNGKTEATNGTYVPKCQRDGLYYNKQCETGTGLCWCVDQDGKEISKKAKDVKCT